MKPLRARIREAASSTGIGEQVIEKDYALSYILAGIAAQPEMSGSMIFKGGYSCVDDFFTKELMNEARTHWNSNLRPFVSQLPSCDIVIEDLRALVRSLLSSRSD